MEEILLKQRKYFLSGATLPVKKRIYALKSLYLAIKNHTDDIAKALACDLGKSPFESFMCETGMVLSEISHMLKHIKKYANNEKVRTPLAQFPAKSYIKKSPYGCVLIMSPWNYPFMLSVEPLVDALAAGNCAIIKPSAYSPSTSALLEKMIAETFPPEHVTVITGGRKENERLLDLPFDKIFFTGNSEVGKTVMRKAAERLIPVTLELGGKSPCIVDESAKIPLAARRIVFGKFLNCGQTCVAPDYVLVHRSVEKQLLKAIRQEIHIQFGKNPLDNPDYGKIINQKHFERLSILLDSEKIYCGGERNKKTLQISPTVLSDIHWKHKSMQEEIFGPVLPVISYSDCDIILQTLNERPKPLAMYIFTENKSVAEYFLSRYAFGGGCVNDVVIHLATSEMGFGGFGESGMGAYHGKKGFDCFTHKKSIVHKSTSMDLPVRYQPYSKQKERMLKRFLK